jgi:lipoprotein-anchoring transpeptidase ErfK/SrfK
VVFPLALTGPSKIKQQRTMQAITVVRGSADTSIPPQLSREVQVRLATHGWQSKSTLITVGGVGAGDPALAAPERISPRIKALLQSALHLDTPMGVQKRLIELGYLPAGTTSSDYGISQAIMAFQGWEGLPRDGVADAATQTAMLTAKRPTATRPGKGKRIEVDIGKQVLLLEDGSKVLRVIHVSTGATGNTPRGNYSIIRKENPSWVPEFKIWLQYTSYFIGGFAMHEYPDVPGYPASHGCVRIGSPFSAGVYEFATSGTPVYLH